jgi:hypothetical protein
MRLITNSRVNKFLKGDKMRKLLCTAAMVMLSVTTMAEGGEKEVILKPGWNLLGTSFEVTDLSTFNSGENKEKVLILWRWDAENQEWIFYTPHDIIREIVAEYGYTKSFENIPAFQGFWVKVTKETHITLPYEEISEPSVNHPPAITVSKNSVSVEEGKTATVNVKVSDPDGDTVTVNVQSSDTNVATATYDKTTGKLTITGVANGTATITLTADDGNGGTANATITVTVTAAQQQGTYDVVRAVLSGNQWFHYWDKDKSGGWSNGDVSQPSVLRFDKWNENYELRIYPSLPEQSTWPDVTSIQGYNNLCFMKSGQVEPIGDTEDDSKCDAKISYVHELTSGNIYDGFKGRKLCVVFDDGEEVCKEIN